VESTAEVKRLTLEKMARQLVAARNPKRSDEVKMTFVKISPCPSFSKRGSPFTMVFLFEKEGSRVFTLNEATQNNVRTTT